MATQGDLAKMIMGQVPLPPKRPDIFQQAIGEFPILNETPFGHVVTPDPNDQRMLEFFGPNEAGDPDFPRPQGLPMGMPGVQVISPKTRPEDVAADIVSHYLVNRDPTLSQKYQQFVDTFNTPAGQARLKQDYAYSQQHEASMYPGGLPPMPEWAQRARIPAYFRGYVFDQWPQSSFSQMYTPQQLEILKGISQYVRQKRPR